MAKIRRPAACGRRLRGELRFDLTGRERRILRSVCFTQHTHVTVHCFEEFIGERAFEIEVTDAGNRWRAQLRRRPGVPTAMMPFYGASPAEAAHRLMDWMRRAYERQLAAATPRA